MRKVKKKVYFKVEKKIAVKSCGEITQTPEIKGFFEIKIRFFIKNKLSFFIVLVLNAMGAALYLGRLVLATGVRPWPRVLPGIIYLWESQNH